MKPRTTARARLLTASAVALLLAFVLILSLPTPAAAFPSHKIHDRSIAAAGLGGIAVGDVNGDTVLDIAVLDEAAGSVVVFTQGATGLPAAPSVSIAAEGARKIALEDIDVDGDADLIVVRPDEVAILYNDWGEFDIRVAEIAVPGVTAVAIADFGTDSLPDL
ncbi:MAG: VCBS repeat-containing protein, partial [Candidatus Thermoplasmatota archaeon]